MSSKVSLWTLKNVYINTPQNSILYHPNQSLSMVSISYILRFPGVELADYLEDVLHWVSGEQDEIEKDCTMLNIG